MSSRPVALPQSPEGAKIEDLYFFALPTDTYIAISDVAAKRGLTFAQALTQALDTWMRNEIQP